MESFIHSNIYLIFTIIINLTLFILYILNNIKLTKLRKNYSDFMTKLGKGNNIDEMIKRYVEKVDIVEKENNEIKLYCDKLNNKTDNCISKVGLIRYNAFKDTGSNLSFAVTLLNKKNNGVVLNGIYSRDSSNIYCKTVKDGVSEYAISEEEKQSIEKTVNEK